MTKTYRSDTSVSVSVVLPSGESLHVAFQTLSNGTSYYVTDSPDIQRGLERHARYGRLFTLVSEADLPKREPKRAKAAKESGALTRIKVSDWGAAKDYLADRFGISRSALKSHLAITKSAEAHGIAFDGLEPVEAGRE